MDSFTPARVTKWTVGESPREADDLLAREEPLEIRVRGQAISVTMRTPAPGSPGTDAELAAGFLLTEGVIRRRSDVVSIDASPRHPDGNVINVFLAPEVPLDLQRLTRHVFASSSCGLCGKATIDALRCSLEAVDSDVTVPASTLLSLPEKLRAAQSTFDKTGGLHAAAIFDEHGQLIVVREDVGRHNAVDKAIGYAFLHEISLDRHVLMVSGRSSFEIAQKALAARLPIIAAVSAPSSLAAELAGDSGQTLVGFLRDNRMNVYTHPRRIRFD
jgi:FdhD protein